MAKQHKKIKKRDAEKAAKVAKAEALAQVSKESIAADRKKQEDKKQTPKAKQGGSPEPAHKDDAIPKAVDTAPPVLGKKAPVSPPIHGEALPKTKGSECRMSAGTSSVPQRHVSTQSSLLEEDEETPEVQEPEPEVPTIPWHHEQLYHLYGKDADYFLHPKMEDKERRRKKVAKPEARKHRHLGRLGANELWTSLRNDSLAKIKKEEQGIPSELKLPHLLHLMNLGHLKDTQDYKHKVEMMYRASQNNEDRSRILLFNNPVPNLNNFEGDESVSRYMPAWMKQEDDTESELSYKKWVGAQEANGAPAKDLAPLSDEWKFLTLYRTKKDRQKKPQYCFLTEKAATVPGEFSKRRQELLDSRRYPQAHKGTDQPETSDNQQCLRHGNQVGSRLSPINKPGCHISRSAPCWPPLSLGAVGEYKENVLTTGSGQFAHGQPPVWSTAVVS